VWPYFPYKPNAKNPRIRLQINPKSHEFTLNFTHLPINLCVNLRVWLIETAMATSWPLPLPPPLPLPGSRPTRLFLVSIRSSLPKWPKWVAVAVAVTLAVAVASKRQWPAIRTFWQRRRWRWTGLSGKWAKIDAFWCFFEGFWGIFGVFLWFFCVVIFFFWLIDWLTKKTIAIDLK
jgi:hypothetical protein